MSKDFLQTARRHVQFIERIGHQIEHGGVYLRVKKEVGEDSDGGFFFEGE